jgi:hypothetical protein
MYEAADSDLFSLVTSEVGDELESVVTERPGLEGKMIGGYILGNDPWPLESHHFSPSRYHNLHSARSLAKLFLHAAY